MLCPKYDHRSGLSSRSCQKEENEEDEPTTSTATGKGKKLASNMIQIEHVGNKLSDTLTCSIIGEDSDLLHDSHSAGNRLQ